MKNARGKNDRRCTEAIAANTKDAIAYRNRGIDFYDKGDFDKAILDFTKAIDIDPQCADFYYSRGHTYQSLGKYDNAITDFTRAINLSPTHAKAYNARGSIYSVIKQDGDKAFADHTKAIEIDPDDEIPF
jgi:tetratricopeptide (TPR) repeat protein